MIYALAAYLRDIDLALFHTINGLCGQNLVVDHIVNRQPGFGCCLDGGGCCGPVSASWLRASVWASITQATCLQERSSVSAVRLRSIINLCVRILRRRLLLWSSEHRLFFTASCFLSSTRSPRYSRLRVRCVTQSFTSSSASCRIDLTQFLGDPLCRLRPLPVRLESFSRP